MLVSGVLSSWRGCSRSRPERAGGPPSQPQAQAAMDTPTPPAEMNSRTTRPAAPEVGETAAYGTSTSRGRSRAFERHAEQVAVLGGARRGITRTRTRGGAAASILRRSRRGRGARGALAAVEPGGASRGQAGDLSPRAAEMRRARSGGVARRLAQRTAEAGEAAALRSWSASAGATRSAGSAMEPPAARDSPRTHGSSAAPRRPSLIAAVSKAGSRP
jgi:hypothetical protein